MKLKLMEIVQQVEYLTEEQIKKGIVCSYIQDYCYILHDKDVLEDGTPKKAHWHIYLRLKDSTDSKYIAKAFEVEEQYINKVKGKWVDVLLYSTHKNRPEKHQYDDNEVTSNFDFAKVRDAEEKKKISNNRLSEIIELIDNGTIREYNYFNYITMSEYTKYKRQIDMAFKYRLDRMKGDKTRMLNCIFITGTSGCGKTTYAKMLAEEKKMSYYISSGSNDVLDDYAGEDCLILDDLRPSCMGLSDLLKMLDNNTASSVKSRFKNKVLECKMIIITTVLPIENFFKNVFTEEPESAIQLYRRCQMYIHMDNKDMKVFLWNHKNSMYVMYGQYPNPVEFVSRERTEEEEIQFVENLLGNTIQGLQRVKKDFREIRGVVDPFKV